jgi:hypothetical protein
MDVPDVLMTEGSCCPLLQLIQPFPVALAEVKNLAHGLGSLSA